MINITQERLSSVLYCYGIITFLMILEHYQEEEEYHLCKMMVDAINEHNKRSNEPHPTKMCDRLVDNVVLAYTQYGFNVSPQQIMDRQRDYADSLIKDFNKLVC